MKITSTAEFVWIHKGIDPVGENKSTLETYNLGHKPVEITEEAYNHLIDVFGEKMFTIVGKEKETKKEENG